MNDNPTALPTTALNGNVLNLSQLAGGTYRYRGTLIINDNINGNNTPISDVSTGGVPITLAVDGDVYIESDITYSYSSPNNIPQLNVYASGAEQPPSPYYPDYFYVDIGNIYVQNDVTEIHGYFAAEGDQVDLIPAQDYGHAWADLSTYVFGDGLFADCAMIDPATGIITTYADSGTCNRQLDIDGSVGANVVYLERSYGGLQPEASFACATNADCAAEVFQYSPEVWVPDAVGTSCVGTASQCIGDSYESVTYLPPSL
jgi:hypothetical protein